MNEFVAWLPSKIQFTIIYNPHKLAINMLNFVRKWGCLLRCGEYNGSLDRKTISGWMLINRMVGGDDDVCGIKFSVEFQWKSIYVYIYNEYASVYKINWATSSVAFGPFLLNWYDSLCEWFSWWFRITTWCWLIIS